jgi:UDP-N-acetylglucosamine--N-acetylmuramyl-(pentapeptide) pyrophosphoryl-undecaprenol N-acetylglucosamine transferase
MKIVFTGGGTGGHFYPLIAVAEAVRDVAKEKKLLEPQMYYFAPEPYDDRTLFETGIEFRKTSAGKIRRYFSIYNFFDIFRTSWGIVKATFLLYSVYPDVVFSKGAYASVPTVFAARLLRIPIVIHDSDAAPGRANLWAARFARNIGISYPEAASYFPKDKVALVGNPVRKEIREPAYEGAKEFLNLEQNVPVILFLGGSTGAKKLNDILLQALPKLVDSYQIIHQTGEANFKEISGTANVILEGHAHKARYKPYNYLNSLAMRMSSGAAMLAVSRAGSGAIFELATWGLPAILVPIPTEISHDQHKNAFSYARTGAAIVIEENNLTPNLLISEIQRLIDHPDIREKMKQAGLAFAKPEAARMIAELLLSIGVSHED